MKQFMKTFFAVCSGLIFVSLLVVLVIAGIVGGDDRPEVKKDSILTLNLGIPISDKPLNQGIGDAVQSAMGNGIEKTNTLRSVTQAINHASSDSRITALYIHGATARAGYYSGWAALKEVRQAIEQFKESGKPVIAYETALDEAGLYMMSIADEFYLNPMGYIEFNGFAAQIMFFKKAFDKYGVDVQVTKVGKYKSAVEPFLLEGMSQPNREQLELLLNDFFDETVNGIANARGCDSDLLRNLSDTQGFLTAKVAMSHSLIDEAVFYDDVIARLRELTGTKDGEKIERQIDVTSYYTAIKDTKQKDDRIAIIYAEGTIVDGGSEKEVGGDHVAQLLRKAREDENVKAVVLRVNSPGGSALASDVIQRETRLIKESKPFVVSMGTVAASGGYWISTYADQIFAQPNTVTGSIGVFGMFPNFQKIMNEHGVVVDVAKTSTMADSNSSYRPKTEAELAVFQTFVDEIYEIFLSKVMEGRKLERAHVAEIAEGRVWSGVQALNLGLVDQLGGLDEAVADAAKRANLTGKYSIVDYQKSKSFADELMSMAGMDQTQLDQSVTADLTRLWHDLQSLQSQQGVQAKMPFELVIR